MPDLTALVESHLQSARASTHRRSTELVVHDGVLRQTVIALAAGAELGEHNAPPAASVQVLHGRVRVTGQGDEELAQGRLVTLAHERHAVVALEDAVFLLTTVTSVDDRDGGPGETRGLSA
ncbi:cupin [Cellulomonas marina]|uniref:Cupin n=1 Tax=Cellulomonas marina TaxID=988821 RepID=A0A1I0X8J1_9CELL|nr:cupin [Cellulomonas marina]GIG29516.1 hypothetical protein Cma02nite_21160 [Cellulomonas marina]SFA97379.1 hypothetical protein SAMN05421867_104211 [Cellulomonas marina]